MRARPAAVARRGARAAEQLMTEESCEVYQPTGRITDPVTGVVTPDFTLVWSGPMKVKSAGQMAATPEAGEHQLVVEHLEVHFPLSAPTFLPHCEVQVLPGSPHVGHRFQLLELKRGTFVTAHRWSVQLITT